jgi:hypothetical protein
MKKLFKFVARNFVGITVCWIHNVSKLDLISGFSKKVWRLVILDNRSQEIIEKGTMISI